MRQGSGLTFRRKKITKRTATYHNKNRQHYHTHPENNLPKGIRLDQQLNKIINLKSFRWVPCNKEKAPSRSGVEGPSCRFSSILRPQVGSDPFGVLVLIAAAALSMFLLLWGWSLTHEHGVWLPGRL
eukprot:scaffold115_cov172-Amphora_coffeaeformis.AAC.10